MLRIFLCSLLALPLAAQARLPEPPAPKELKTLALESVLACNRAIQARDFTTLRDHISALWRKQTTPQRLQETFQSFIDQAIDLSSVSNVEPVVDEAVIDNAGVLLLQGRYQVSPCNVEFRLRFIREKRVWKLIGIKVDVTPADRAPSELPTRNETQAVARDSMLAFRVTSKSTPSS